MALLLLLLLLVAVVVFSFTFSIQQEMILFDRPATSAHRPHTTSILLHSETVICYSTRPMHHCGWLTARNRTVPQQQHKGHRQYSTGTVYVAKSLCTTGVITINTSITYTLKTCHVLHLQYTKQYYNHNCRASSHIDVLASGHLDSCFMSLAQEFWRNRSTVTGSRL